MSTIRRMMMRTMANDPYANWVKLRTKNANGATKNCFGCDVSYVDRMLVDGVEVTPEKLYDFGDSNYHDVFILFKDTTSIPDNSFWLSNYTITHLDIPASFVEFGSTALRGCGASGNCYVAIRSTTMPAFDGYNFIAWTKGNLYVPSNLMADYKTLTGLADSKIHPLEDYPYDFNAGLAQ